MKKIIILTGSGVRHTFFRYFLAKSENIEVITSYCESGKNNLEEFVCKQSDNKNRDMHLKNRLQSEQDFFGLFNEYTKDESNPIFIKKGDVNNFNYVDKIIEDSPDIIISYGCSIIKSSLIEKFYGRFVNIHLGLSPYYRGAGTNYWPLVNLEPEYVGVTFLFIDKGIDTGEIVHQIFARIYDGDTPSAIGNRLITDMALECVRLIDNFDRVLKMPQPKTPSSRVYKKSDYTEESVKRLYSNFTSGRINIHSKSRSAIDIVSNHAMKPHD